MLQPSVQPIFPSCATALLPDYQYHDNLVRGFPPNPKAPLRQQLHEVMRFFHYSPRTEEAYRGWIVPVQSFL